MSGVSSVTFLSLIPKEENLVSFGELRPIVLCNFINKLVTKIIAIRLNCILFERISKEQSGSLLNKQILEVGVTQECLHSTKTKRLKSLILKMDLAKAFDKVDWGFLCLALI